MKQDSTTSPIAPLSPIAKLARNSGVALALLFSTAIAAPLHAQEAEAQPSATAASAQDEAAPIGWNPADWGLEDSEYTPEAGWVFGKLDNGMRYIIRRNAKPEGTALVRMNIAAGSLDENDDELGYAHFIEHMAFNGSTNVPEGEMIKLLEREGLAFGADTNASTRIDRTDYALDLPRNNPELLDTALMLMRETTSELTIAPDAVDRERGVILSERRVRNDFNMKDTVDTQNFMYPDARFPNRLPIGTVESIEQAKAEGLRAFWQRVYVPAKTVLTIVGDYDPALVESTIRKHFSSWKAAPSPDQPDGGPINAENKGRTDIYLDPALPDRIEISRSQAYVDKPDTLEEGRKSTLASIGKAIVGTRLNRIFRSENPPFAGAAILTNDQYKTVRTTQLIAVAKDGQWQQGLNALVDEYRRALQYGFSEAEIAEQISNRRTVLENRVANAATRSNAQLTGDANFIAFGKGVPAAPAIGLAQFNQNASSATPEAVLEAYKISMVDLSDPLIRFSGKAAPEGGEDALRAAVNTAFKREVAPPKKVEKVDFAYTDFGKPGKIVSDTKTGDYDIRTLRFANGVMLNLKPTDLAEDKISVQVMIDGGNQLATRENPLATELAGLLVSGGLGKHSINELQPILAGRSVAATLSSNDDHFSLSSTTTKRDFELQLQYLTAYIADPGYRPEGFGPFQARLEEIFARLNKTPASAIDLSKEARLTDDDPRFVLHPIEAYRALTYDKMKADISDRLDNGAMEVSIVGDFDEDEAIAIVAKSFGALPQREADFKPYDDGRRAVAVTQDRSDTTITHDGEPDQAMVSFVWPTNDDEDWVEASQFNMLARILNLMLTEKLREELGQTYTPSVSSNLSDQYDDYGVFSASAPIDVKQLDEAKAAFEDVVENLLANPPSEDLMQRARQPIYEILNNRLKSNGSWMHIVSDAQSDPTYIERFKNARARYEAITPEDILALARKYLQPKDAIRFSVVPSEEALAKDEAEAAAE